MKEGSYLPSLYGSHANSEPLHALHFKVACRKVSRSWRRTNGLLAESDGMNRYAETGSRLGTRCVCVSMTLYLPSLPSHGSEVGCGLQNCVSSLHNRAVRRTTLSTANHKRVIGPYVCNDEALVAHFEPSMLHEK